jgi:Na+/H+ antiporter NhaD/arsenite permease-like protein
VLSGIHEIQEIIEKVEMATLLFFAGLFVLMRYVVVVVTTVSSHGLALMALACLLSSRCIEEMGVMLFIADLTADLIAVVPEGRLRLGVACVMLIWVCAIVSAFIDNIPFTTTMVLTSPPAIFSLASLSLTPSLSPLYVLKQRRSPSS